MLKIYISLIAVVFFVHGDDNLLLLNELKKSEGWDLVESRSDSIRVYEKRIQNMKLKALKVEKIIDFDYSFVLNTVMDLGEYPEIMSNSDIISVNSLQL